MVYLNFTKITPPAPNDPVVDEVTQLNNNWDLLDSKLGAYLTGGPYTDLEVGQEYIDGDSRIPVWDGSAGILPDDTIDSAWSAWTAWPILAPRVARPSFTPRWRNNSILRMVQCSGGVLFDNVSSAWTLGSAFTITADAAGAPGTSLQPINGKVVSTGATGASDDAGGIVVAGALLTADVSGSHVRLRAQYMGGPGGGNFIMLDQLFWWY